MKMDFKLTTKILEYGKIEQSLIKNQTETLARWVADTRDKAIRDALISLGWTPPEKSGKTTSQMKQAPYYAIYIWRNDHLYYPLQLATKLGRDDLYIKSPRWLERGSNIRSFIPSDVIVDHAAELDSKQMIGLNEILNLIRS
jgi:hypothetical protein